MRVADLVRDGRDAGADVDRAVEESDAADVAAVIALTHHIDAGVRLAAVRTLPGLSHGDPPSAAMVHAMVTATRDAEAQVRDWACFALGQVWDEVDTDTVRDALAARLDDADTDTRCEALYGLARRQDRRAAAAVQAALSRPDGDLYRLELLAAGALGDPQLHPLVLGHQTGWDDDEAVTPTATLVRRLTDPAGVGADVVDGVAELLRRRAHGRPDGDALDAWTVMARMLDIAPRRAQEFFDQVRARLSGDEAAVRELEENSAVATIVGFSHQPATHRDGDAITPP